MRTATIRIRNSANAIDDLRSGFLTAWNSGNYSGEYFDFESPAALFRFLTPKRWELIECLQKSGPLGVRALARMLGRDVKRVHEDVKTIESYGLVERTEDNKLSIPFGEIRADFVMRSAA